MVEECGLSEDIALQVFWDDCPIYTFDGRSLGMSKQKISIIYLQISGVKETTVSLGERLGFPKQSIDFFRFSVNQQF